MTEKESPNANFERFKSSLSSIGQLAERIGSGSFDITADDSISSVKRALEKEIDFVKIIRNGADIRIRTNGRSYAAKADFNIRGEKGKFAAGAGGDSEGETYKNFRWLSDLRGVSAEKIWERPEILEAIVDTVYALTAVYDQNKVAEREIKK